MGVGIIAGWCRIRPRDESEAPAGGRIGVVILRRESRDGTRHLAREAVARRWRGKADVGLKRERGKSIDRRFLVGAKAGDLADHLCRHGYQVGARELVTHLGGVGRKCAERGGADQVGSGDGAEQALGASPLLPLADHFDEALLFELAEMVVELLPGLAQAPSKTGGGGGLGELGEEAEAQGVKQKDLSITARLSHRAPWP